MGVAGRVGSSIRGEGGREGGRDTHVYTHIFEGRRSDRVRKKLKEREGGRKEREEV